MPRTDIKEAVNQQVNRTNSVNGYKTRSEAVGSHTANQQTNKIKENAIATAQAMAKLEALETINEFNRIKASGEYFDYLSEALEMNGMATLNILEARIEELEAFEGVTLPLLTASPSPSHSPEELN